MDVGYAPSWVEWSLLAGFVAAFVFLYGLFTRFFPIVSIWEVREGREHAIAEVTERVRRTLPGVPGRETALATDGRLQHVQR